MSRPVVRCVAYDTQAQKIRYARPRKEGALMYAQFRGKRLWAGAVMGIALMIIVVDIGGTQPWEVGDTTSFYYFDFHFFALYDKTQTTLRGVGDHCYVWTQDSSWEKGLINQDDIEALLEAFEERTPAADNTAAGMLSDTSSIFLKLTDLYGEPPDVDGDSMIYILIMDCTEGIGDAPMPGYFDPVNQLTPLENPFSNHHEMIYIDCDPFDPGSDLILGSAAQQFAHLLQYHNDPDEECWIAEGLSYLSQFLCGYGVANQGQIFSKEPLTFYNKSVLTNCREQPEAQDQVKTAMFMQYLFEQYGIEVIETLAADTDNSGAEAVTAALAATGFSDVDFDSVFFDEQLAWFLDSPQEWFYGGKYSFTYYESGSMLDAKTYTTWCKLEDPPYFYPGNQWSMDWILVNPPAPCLGQTIIFKGDEDHNFRLTAIKANLEWHAAFDAEKCVSVEFLTLDEKNLVTLDVSGYGQEYTMIYLAVLNKDAKDGSRSGSRFVIHNEYPIFLPPLSLRAQDQAPGEVPLSWEPPLVGPRRAGEVHTADGTGTTCVLDSKRAKERFYEERKEGLCNGSEEKGLLEYRLYRSDFSGGPYQNIAVTNAAEYVDANVVGGQTYYYVVTAVYEDPEGESGYSNEVSATPRESGETATLWTAISDHGVYGNADFQWPNFEWPGGSENDYGWEGRFWAGAIVDGEDRVSHADYGNYEFYPFGGFGTQWYYEIGIDVFDMSVAFTDRERLLGHYPLGLEVFQRARMWPESEPEYDDVLALEVSVVNAGTQEYENFFVAWNFDADACQQDFTDPHIDDLVDYDGWDGPDSKTDELPEVYPGLPYDRGDVVDPFDWDEDGHTGYDEWGVPYGDPDNPSYAQSLIEPDGFPDEYTLLLDDRKGQRIAFKHPDVVDSIVVYGFAVPRNMSYMYDGDHLTTPDQDFQQRDQRPYPCDGYIGGRLIYTPSRLYAPEAYSNYSGPDYALSDSLMMPYCHSWWNWENDPASDTEKLEFMDGRHAAMQGKRYMVNPHHPDFNAPVFDYRWLQTTGPFDFPVGDTLKFVYVVAVGRGLQGLRKNVDMALSAYYQGSTHSDPYHPSDFDSDTHWHIGLTGMIDEPLNEGPVVTGYRLEQNYPNPFNPTTTISYCVPSTEQRARSGEKGLDSGLNAFRTTLKIYNLLGQEVRTLVEETRKAGYYTVTWNGRDNTGNEVSSGVYFYRINAGDYTATKRMVLIK